MEVALGGKHSVVCPFMKLIEAQDVYNALIFASLAPAAWLLPEHAWGVLARAWAGAHIALRGPMGGDLGEHPVLLACNESPYVLERSILAGKYEEILQMLREHRPGGWNGSIRLLGFQHLERALDSKRGAVLWVAPCIFAELNVKKALHAAGYRVSNLRSHIHPFSGTRFGRAILNPVRTSVEDRLLASTVVLRPGNATTVLCELQDRLRENDLVYITANSDGDRPCRLPFLGGTLSLALGAATLARIARAPLLPVFASPAYAGVYEVEVEAALEPAEGLVARRYDEHLAAAYAARLEAFVKRQPNTWPGWFNRRQWAPLRVTVQS